MTLTAAQTIQAHRMTEGDLLANVIECAALMGWRHYHTHTSTHSPAGFPDLVLIRVRPPHPPQLIFAELKREGKGPTTAQAAWLADCHAISISAALMGRPNLVQAFLWKPSDWHDGTIEAVLRRPGGGEGERHDPHDISA